MHVVMHIGMPKTGSTALQRSLADNRERLRAHGILYPRLTHLRHAHHMLMPLFLPPEAVWGRVRDYIGPDFTEAGLVQWRAVLDQVRRHRPATLVLSTEALFSSFDMDRLDGFAKLLRTVSNRVTLVAYVREPAAYYRSILIERAKRMSRSRPADPVVYRQPIEQLRDALGAAVIVRPFDRASLHKADITSDFLMHSLGIDLGEMVVVDGNVSLSPEAAAVFQRFMQARTSASSWPVRDAEMQVIRDLLEIERDLGRPGTALRSDVAEQVTYASTDLLWLRDALGIRFGVVDYNRLRESASRGEIKVRSLRDAFDFDEDFYCRVLEVARFRHSEIRRHLPAAAA